MKMNDIADQIYDYLATKHARVYRNKSPQSPVYPYVVFRLDSVVNTLPSEDLYLNIDIYESPDVSVRAIETIADTIDGDGLTATGLNMRVINTTGFALRFIREQRQWIGSGDLINAQMINMRYVLRAYFKN